VALVLIIISVMKYFQSKHGKETSPFTIYFLIILTYVYCGLFTIYEGVWAHPNIPAVLFMIFLMCSLLIFILPPLVGVCLHSAAIVGFIIAAVSVKTPEIWFFDIENALIAGIAGIVFTWFVMMLRMSSVSNAYKLEEERELYYRQSTIDELTQLKNRRDFDQTFQRMLTNSRYNDDDILCVALLDIDYFKPFNDFYGHSRGDDCLRSIGKLLKDLQKSMSIYIARVGGEEIAFLWFEKEASNAGKVAQGIINMVQDLRIPHEKSDAAPFVTASIGVYATHKNTTKDKNALYQRADKALYEAKMNGRNRAVVNF
jgi:diguanylate cyclase (GGDEF)-like protein